MRVTQAFRLALDPTPAQERRLRTELQLARLNAKVHNIRRDALHKLTSKLPADCGTVVVERLNAHGPCRAGSRGLQRALHDASVAEIRRQVSYKTAWRGGTLIEAPTFFASSKTCCRCGAVKAKLPLSTCTYCCEHCGLEIDRDLNAARNLAALVETVVAGSGSETENPQSPTQVSPGLARRRVDREPGSPARRKTGTAFEQSEAA